jgi:AcrR family transcriptional regulator
MVIGRIGAQLAGQELDHRHVCVLAEGSDDAFQLLLPFIAEGLQLGQRAVHVVDPDQADTYLVRLASHGIPDSGRDALDVRSWDGWYVRHGRFDGRAAFIELRHTLDAGRRLGYVQTRFIGDMGWATSGLPGVDDLIGYEARLEQLARSHWDVIVCVYDVRQHSRSRIADLLAVHGAAVINGELRRPHALRERGARERILDAASDLFSESGVRAVGVDVLIEAAGVAKATFYRHFPSKDDLVVAWLGDSRSRWFDRVRAQAEETARAPAEILPSFFEAVAEWLEAQDFRGCPYLNSSVELDPTHPARGIIRAYLEEIQDYFGEVLAAAGYREPGMLAAELHTLLAGAISLAVARRTGSFALAAREAALVLLANAEREADSQSE